VDWGAYRRMKVFVRPYAGRLVVILLTGLAATALGLVQPYISKLLIDVALMRREWWALCRIAALMFGVTTVSFALNILSSYQYVRAASAMLFDMRVALYRHMQKLSPRFYAKWRLGDLVSRLNSDISEVQRVSADTLLALLSNIVFLAGSITIMFYLNWRLFLLSVALVPLCLFVFHHYQQKLTVFAQRLRERAADAGSLFVDTLIGMRTVVASNGEEYEVGRIRDRNRAFIDTLLRFQITSSLSGALPGTILTASTALVFLYGGKMVIDGDITIGTLVAFMAYHLRLLSPVHNIMTLAANLASGRASLARMFEILDTTVDITERPGAVPLGPVHRKIALENVVFRHDREIVLNGLSFEIPAGTLCAILGPSGAGKSTIADLLVRFLDPDEGRILIDGQDIRDVCLEDLRREVVLVDQAPHLFNVTIAENISYTISRLPQGYDTVAGERGLALSAGERQRIALARALLRKPTVLILDEPTSALDPEMEAILARNLRESLRGCTVIVITHRPALAEIADEVLHLRAGKILAVRSNKPAHNPERRPAIIETSGGPASGAGICALEPA
jgi:ATP-binding cassette subfamily B protein